MEHFSLFLFLFCFSFSYCKYNCPICQRVECAMHRVVAKSTLLLHDACKIIIVIMFIWIHEAHMMINCHWFWVCKHANGVTFNGIEQWQFAMNSDNWQIFRIFFNIYLFLILNPMRQCSNIIVRPDENRKIPLQWKLVIMKPFSQLWCELLSFFLFFL